MSKLKLNLFLQTLYQVFSMVAPLITAPYVTRVLKAEGLGIHSFTYTIVGYFAIVAMLGTNNYGSRSVARVRDDKIKRSKAFFEIYSLQVVVTVLTLAAYICYLMFFCKQNLVVAWIQILILVSCLFKIEWFFIGIEAFKVTVLRSTVLRIISIVLVFILVKVPSDLWKYVLILALGEVFGQAVFLFGIRKYIVRVKITFKDVTKHIYPNLILFVPAIAYSLNHYLDKSMLGWLSDYSNVGFYSNVEKLIMIPLKVLEGIGVVMMTRVSNLVANGKTDASMNYLTKAIVYIGWFAVAMSFGVAAISKEFVPLFFGEEFASCVGMTMVMSFCLISKTIRSINKTQVFIPYKMDVDYTKTMMASALINVTLNSLLIPGYGAMGAIVATVIAETLAVGYEIYLARNVLNLWSYIKKILPFLPCGACMFIIVRIIAGLTSNIGVVASMLCEIVIGGISYIIVAGIVLMLIDENVKQLIKGFLNKSSGTKLEIK